MSKKTESLVFPVNCEERTAGNLYSGYDVQKAMKDFLEEALPQAGFTLNMMISNVRLILMASACLGGAYSHYYCKFPRDTWIIGFFSAAYLIQSGIVVALDYFRVKNSCAILDDKVTGSQIFVDVNPPSGDSNITLALRSNKLTVSSGHSVGKYFDEDGILNQRVVFAEFSSLYEQFKAQSKQDKKKD